MTLLLLVELLFLGLAAKTLAQYTTSEQIQHFQKKYGYILGAAVPSKNVTGQLIFDIFAYLCVHLHAPHFSVMFYLFKCVCVC